MSPPESSPPDVPSTDAPPPEAPDASQTEGSAGREPPTSAPDTQRLLTSPPTNGEPGDDAPPLVVLPARDTVGGHLTIGASAGVVFPFGSIASGTAQEGSLIGPGPRGSGGDILYGVSRTVAVGAYGEVATPSGRNEGSGQDFTTIAAGPMVRHHLAQGVRFDPWLSAGAGFRQTSITAPAALPTSVATG